MYNNQQQLFPASIFANLQTELVEKFGGITSYSRAPAKGLWKEDSVQTIQDDIIIYKIMVTSVDPEWWSSFKCRLKVSLEQEEIILRTLTIEII